jgi:hypothetical protein
MQVGEGDESEVHRWLQRPLRAQVFLHDAYHPDHLWLGSSIAMSFGAATSSVVST